MSRKRLGRRLLPLSTIEVGAGQNIWLVVTMVVSCVLTMTVLSIFFDRHPWYTSRSSTPGMDGAVETIRVDPDLTALFEGNCHSPKGEERYLFSRGFRSSIFSALKAVNNFYRLANETGRISVGPYIHEEKSFKLSSFYGKDKRAKDYIGNFFKLKYYDYYENLCSFTGAVSPETLCPNKEDIEEVCIGYFCPSESHLVSTDEALTVYEDIVDTFKGSERLSKAKCVILNGYHRGVQDPLLATNDYKDLYKWTQPAGIDDNTAWIYDAFQPSEEMAKIAKDFRTEISLVSNNYIGLHILSQRLSQEVCKKEEACECEFSNVVEASIREWQLKNLDDFTSPVYLAWDSSSNVRSISDEVIEETWSMVQKRIGEDRLHHYTNADYMAIDIMVDHENLVESRSCVSFGGGALMGSVNYQRVMRGKPPCEVIVQMLDGFC